MRHPERGKRLWGVSRSSDKDETRLAGGCLGAPPQIAAPQRTDRNRWPLPAAIPTKFS